MLPIAQRALTIFDAPTPQGVRVPAEHGNHYAIYSFAPDLRVLNGFIQSLIGLYDYARLSGDPRGTALFEAAEPQARAEVPLYDTGAWSLYSRGSSTHESSLSYHDLLQGFLENLCERTDAEVYCTTAENFVAYKAQPPAVVVKPQAPARRQAGPRVVRALEDLERDAEDHARDEGRGVAAVRHRRLRQADLRLGRPAPARRLHGAARRPRSGRKPGLGAGRRDGAEAQAQDATVGFRGLTPRIILYTGKGGVGKTSVAAATARRCAAAGARTLVLSTDPAHSLAESLQLAVGGEPTEVGGGVWAQQVQAQDELEQNWSAVQGWLGGVLAERGVERIAAEELTVPPGADELFSLLQLKRHAESGEWDTIVVDCAPTGETLRLLSFPDAARWWLDRVMGRENALLSAARPIARAFLDLSLPDERVMEDVQRLVRNLIAMHELLRDASRVTIRLVTTPDRMVVAEAMRTFTYLNLYGYLCDAVVVNRVFPSEVGAYFGAWREVQAEQLALVESGFAPVPVLRAPYFEQEVMGAEMLDRLGGALFDGRDAGAVLHDRLAQELALDGRAGRAAARPAVRQQGRRGAEEDRARARGAGRRPPAHDRAAERAGRLQADVGQARRGLAGGGVRGWLRPTACGRSTRRPSGWCARRSRRPSGPPRARCRRAGWSVPGRDAAPPAFDLAQLTALVESLRGVVPPDLARQLADALRELLLAIRAVLDWYIARLEPPEPPDADVQDIPVEMTRRRGP